MCIAMMVILFVSIGNTVFRCFSSDLLSVCTLLSLRFSGGKCRSAFFFQFRLQFTFEIARSQALFREAGVSCHVYSAITCFLQQSASKVCCMSRARTSSEMKTALKLF